jgi:hypothetical protein
MFSWRAHPNCPSGIRSRLEKAVQALPVGYLEPLQRDEAFESAEACLRRLQRYALSQGFAVVKTSGSLQSKRPRIQYKCVHHSRETKNNRQLETHVQRDAISTSFDCPAGCREQKESTQAYNSVQRSVWRLPGGPSGRH